MPRLLRITTVPISLQLLLSGQFRFMREHGFDLLTASASGREVGEVEKEGVSHVVIPFTRKITPVKDLICLIKLIGLMRKFQPHIIHTHTPKAGLLGMLAGWLCRIPVRMHTVAGLPFMESDGIKRSVLRFAEKLTYALSHRVYPNSMTLMSYLKEELSANPRKLKVLGKGSSNGINAGYFKRSPELIEQAHTIRDQHKIKANEITLAFVGRIVKDKGVAELVNAFDKLGKDRPVRLLLIGSFEEELNPLARTTMQFLKNDPRVVLAGFQDDVRPWLLASDVFVLPSYREGFPNVVMQACCLEVPCIVSDINGSNEIIETGVTGFIVKPKDEQSLYESMRTLAGDPALRLDFGRRSREYVASHFDQHRFWLELLKEYQTRLEEKCISLS